MNTLRLKTLLAKITSYAGNAALLALAGIGISNGAYGQAFVHPGLLHTNADFTRMATKVSQKWNPWWQGWDILNGNYHAQTSYVPHPTADVDRGGSINNYGTFYNDVAAAYQLALQWKVTGNTAYADASINIMNGWSSTLTEVTGDADRFLAFGIYGYEFANAGEIMRTYSGWAPADFARFQNMMMTIFYPGNNDFLTNHNTACIWNYWANWDLCNIASMAAIGVLCDNRTVYNQALNYFEQPITSYGNQGNGGQGTLAHFCEASFAATGTTPVMIEGQESARDQGHAGLDMALLGVIAQQFYNQGTDIFAYTYTNGPATNPTGPGPSNAILAAMEYFCDYNINTSNTVPFTGYWTTLGAAPCGGGTYYPGISPASRGDIRPAWELPFGHYVGLKGLSAPFTTAYAAQLRPEGGGGNYGPNSGGFDQLGFGTLCYTQTGGNPIASGFYSLQNVTDSNTLDSYGLSTNGTNAYQYAPSGSGNQRWNLVQIGTSNTYYIVSDVGMYLDSVGHTGNGAAVGQWSFSGSNNQKWNITSLGGNVYKVQNVANGLYLDTGGLTANGSVMQMWGGGSSTNQQWILRAPL